jgi:hypothetical protein
MISKVIKRIQLQDIFILLEEKNRIISTLDLFKGDVVLNLIYKNS